MKFSPNEIESLAATLAETEDKLRKLEKEIKEIGQPAAHELQRRLDHLWIEERALQRNLSEALGDGQADETKIAKIEALLAYVRSEENSVERDADFLHQSPPSSVEIAAQTGSRLMELCASALKRIIGGHHPLGMSVFVNHSPQELAERYGIDELSEETERN